MKRAGWPSILVAVVLLALGVIAEAQQPKKVPRIGYLSTRDPATESTRAEAIRLALRELGYIEGQNIAIEYRYAEGKRDRLPELAAELVRLKVDIIVVAGGDARSGRPRMRPRRFPSLWWAVGSILSRQAWLKALPVPAATSPALQTFPAELGGKRLELLKEAVPKLARVAVLYDPASPAAVLERERGSPSRGACAGVDYSALGGTSCGRFREGIRCAE